MNEQIEILFKQAGGYVEVDNDGNYFTYTQDFDPDLFAELIVKEMLLTCEEHPAWTGRMIGEQIKQHFGVEE